MTEQTPPAQVDDQVDAEQVDAEQAAATRADAEQADDGTEQADPETFPRAYVERLRREAADARVKAKRADDLARALFAARVAATGRLADPEDLPYTEGLLDDQDALVAAVDALLARKPHLASRQPRGDIAQGDLGAAGGTVNLADMLRRSA